VHLQGLRPRAALHNWAPGGFRPFKNGARASPGFVVRGFPWPPRRAGSLQAPGLAVGCDAPRRRRADRAGRAHANKVLFLVPRSRGRALGATAGARAPPWSRRNTARSRPCGATAFAVAHRSLPGSRHAVARQLVPSGPALGRAASAVAPGGPTAASPAAHPSAPRRPFVFDRNAVQPSDEFQTPKILFRANL
jgi:hypothetical protein